MRIAAVFLMFSPAFAGIWPDTFAGKPRGAVSQPAISDQAIWDEYGLKDSEKADYGGFSATAWRFQDSTGAMAAFQWQRPKESKPSALAKLSAETPGGLLLAHGNYLLRFEKYKPTAAELTDFLPGLPKLDQSSLPPLMDYLPADNLAPNSGRYVTGPASLAAFDPQISASAAGFHLGTECQIGTYGAGMKLAIFSFPTPQIAMQRAEGLGKISGALAKRSGPLVAVIVSPPDPEEAQRLLAKIRYQADLSWSEYVPTQRDNIGNLVINAFILIGILLGFALVAGLAVGMARSALKWRRGGVEPEAMITLHLSGR